MIFKVIEKKNLPRLYELLAGQAIIGPMLKGHDRDGAPLHDFAEITAFPELALDYGTTVHSAKRFVLPHQESLAAFTVAGRDWQERESPGPVPSLVFFGLHACDINALNKLDLVLAGGPYPDTRYQARRRSSFIIGLECRPTPRCFCHSMGTDSALRGYDMFLSDLGSTYFVEVLSATAFAYLSRLGCREPNSREHRLYRQRATEKRDLYTATVDTTDLTKILDLEFEARSWTQWGEKCLSCGTCAQVCPTCYCYGVEEQISLDLRSAEKSKSLHSCNLIDFATVAGGHNFRPESATRLKYRYYHKHRGFVEAFEEPLCVGCGRCSAACLADIAPPEVIASVRTGRT